jgi:hypothetical protein
LREGNNSHVSFLGELDFSELFSLEHHVLVLDAHDTTSPDSSQGFVFVELHSEVLGEEFEVLVVFFSQFGDSDAGGGLLVDELSESCLSLDEAIGDSLLSAESGEEHHHLEGVDVVGDNDELGLAFFDEGGHVVETELEDDWLGGLLGISATFLDLGFLQESLLLFLVGLGLVLSEQFKELGSYRI